MLIKMILNSESMKSWIYRSPRHIPEIIKVQKRNESDTFSHIGNGLEAL